MPRKRPGNVSGPMCSRTGAEACAALAEAGVADAAGAAFGLGESSCVSSSEPISVSGPGSSGSAAFVVPKGEQHRQRREHQPDPAVTINLHFEHWPYGQLVRKGARQNRDRDGQVLDVGIAASIPAIDITDCGFAAGVSVIVFVPAWFCATAAGALTIALWEMV